MTKIWTKLKFELARWYFARKNIKSKIDRRDYKCFIEAFKGWHDYALQILTSNSIFKTLNSRAKTQESQFSTKALCYRKEDALLRTQVTKVARKSK